MTTFPEAEPSSVTVTGCQRGQCDSSSERIPELEQEVKRVRSLIALDRTGLAAGLDRVRAIIDSFGWLPNDGEWGPYDYTNHSVGVLRAEIGACFDQIGDVIEKTLQESGDRADSAVRGEASGAADADASVLAHAAVASAAPSLPEPKPRDESQDMWVYESGGDCLGVTEYSHYLEQSAEDEGWCSEGERYVRYSDLLAVEHQLAQVTRERDGWMQEAARNDEAFRRASDERDELVDALREITTAVARTPYMPTLGIQVGLDRLIDSVRANRKLLSRIDARRTGG